MNDIRDLTIALLLCAAVYLGNGWHCEMLRRQNAENMAFEQTKAFVSHGVTAHKTMQMLLNPGRRR